MASSQLFRGEGARCRTIEKALWDGYLKLRALGPVRKEARVRQTLRGPVRGACCSVCEDAEWFVRLGHVPCERRFVIEREEYEWSEREACSSERVCVVCTRALGRPVRMCTLQCARRASKVWLNSLEVNHAVQSR